MPSMNNLNNASFRTEATMFVVLRFCRVEDALVVQAAGCLTRAAAVLPGLWVLLVHVAPLLDLTGKPLTVMMRMMVLWMI